MSFPLAMMMVVLAWMAGAGRVMGLPAAVSPRMEVLRGTVVEEVAIGKDAGFSFVRLVLAEGMDEAKVVEIQKAIRQRTGFDIRSQKRTKKGEAVIVLDRMNLGGKTPKKLVPGDVIVITGYGVTLPEQARGGSISYEKVEVNGK
ncbi:hypothetical protein [Luteolibacter soli]